jgi:hypothetical protein
MRFRFTVSVDEDVSIVTVGTQEDGVLVNLTLRVAWDVFRQFEQLYSEGQSRARALKKLRSAYSVCDTLCKPDDFHVARALSPFGLDPVG